MTRNAKEFWLILLIVGLLVMVARAAFAQVTQKLDWLLPPDVFAIRAQTNTYTYAVYYGPASGAYTNRMAVGTNLQVAISFPAAGKRYLAVTAANSKGVESDFSNEVSVTNQSVTLAWDPPRGTNYVTPGLVLQGAVSATGPWTDAFWFPAMTLTNPGAVAMFYRVRATITNR